MSDTTAGGGDTGGLDSGILSFLVKLQDSFTAPLQAMTGQINDFKSNIQELGAGLATAFGGFESLKAFVEPAEAMQTSLANLQVTTGATADQLEAAKTQAENLSVQFSTTAEDIVGAQTSLSKYLGSLTAAEQNMNTVAGFAEATGQTATQAAQTLGEAFASLGDKSKPVGPQMTAIANELEVLATKFNPAGQSASMMARSIALISGAATAANIPVQQLVGIMATLNQTGAAGERGAGPMVEALVQSLTKLGKDGLPVLTKFGEMLYKSPSGQVDLLTTLEHIKAMAPAALQAMESAMGPTGATLALLLKNLGSVPAAMTAIQNSAGAVNLGAAIQGNTLAKQFQSAQAAMSNLMDTLGTALLPSITAAVEGFTSMVSAIQKFADAHPVLTEIAGDIAGVVSAAAIFTGTIAAASAAWALLSGGFVGIATMVAGAVAAIGSIGTAVASVGAVLLANPILDAIALLVVGIAAAGYEIYEHWETIKGYFTDAVAWIQSHLMLISFVPIIGPLIAAAVAVSDNWQAIENTFSGAIDWITSHMEALATIMAPFTGGLTLAIAAVADSWSSIQNTFAQAIEWVTANMSTIALAFAPFTLGLSAVALAVADNWTAIKATFEEAVTDLLAIVNDMTDSAIIKFFTQVFPQAMAGIEDDWNLVKGWFSDAVSTVSDLMTALAASPVITFFTQTFAAVVPIVQTAWATIQTAFTEGAKLVEAALAPLIALINDVGAAIKAVVSAASGLLGIGKGTGGAGIPSGATPGPSVAAPTGGAGIPSGALPGPATTAPTPPVPSFSLVGPAPVVTAPATTSIPAPVITALRGGAGIPSAPVLPRAPILPSSQIVVTPVVVPTINPLLPTPAVPTPAGIPPAAPTLSKPSPRTVNAPITIQPANVNVTVNMPAGASAADVGKAVKGAVATNNTDLAAQIAKAQTAANRTNFGDSRMGDHQSYW